MDLLEYCYWVYVAAFCIQVAIICTQDAWLKHWVSCISESFLK